MPSTRILVRQRRAVSAGSSRSPLPRTPPKATRDDPDLASAAADTAGLTFAAIDFETATSRPDSACAVGVVSVVEGAITNRASYLLRPPRRDFTFTHIHGIRWRDVASAPSFAEVWPLLLSLLEGARFLAAHNARFDRAVLETCCRGAGVSSTPLPFRCTLQLARRVWNLHPATLPDVCRRLGIPLRHHEPGSDAEACARVVLAAARRAQNGRIEGATGRRQAPEKGAGE